MNKNVPTFSVSFWTHSVHIRIWSRATFFSIRFRRDRKFEKLPKSPNSQFDEASSPNCFLWQTSGFSGKPLNFYSTDSPTRYPNEGGVYKVIVKSVSLLFQGRLFEKTHKDIVVVCCTRAICFIKPRLSLLWNYYITCNRLYFTTLPRSNTIILYYIISWNKI